MKRIITVFVAILMLVITTVTVYADDAVFTPTTYKTAQGTAVIDGVKDEAYENSDMLTVEKGGLDRELRDGHATAKVWTLWDYDCLYVYAEVNDTTGGPAPNPTDDKAWEIESVEIYIDYENNKTLQNSLPSSAEACQLRICRYPDSYPDITGEGLFRFEFAEGTTYKVIDNKENGYIVEAAISHSKTSFTGKMGFSLQINDDADGDKVRDNVVYVDALQKDAWQFTDLLDTIEFEGFVAPEPTSSEETVSVEETSSAEATASLGTVSLDTPQQSQATLDPVISLIVFALAAGAIVLIIVFTTKKN